MNNRLLRPFLLWLSLGLLSGVAGIWGCGAGNPYPPGSFQRGVFFAENGKNLEAVSAFESYVRKNPTDSLAAEAQFRKAMTYMAMKEYPLAAVEFRILRKDYPTSPLVEEGAYREGLAYLRQVGRIERDISGAYQARVHFKDFLESYPNSVFRPEVEKSLTEISDMIVAKRLREINVYRQLGRYRAVATSLDNVLADEPGSSLMDKVLWQRAEVAFRLQQDTVARSFLQKLADQYPDSPLAAKARAKLASDGGAAPSDSLQS